jgi:ubiquinone biosynthesis protein
VCEPIFNKPLKDISFGLVLLQLFQAVRQFDMEIQPQLVLLQKTLLQIEGLGRQLYPELDLWQTGHPILEQWMRERNDPRTIVKQLVAAWPEISGDLALLPRVLHRALRRADVDDAGEAAAKRRGLAPRAVESRRDGRLERAVIGAGLLIAGVLWSALAVPEWLGWVGAAMGLVVLALAARR